MAAMTTGGSGDTTRHDSFPLPHLPPKASMAFPSSMRRRMVTCSVKTLEGLGT